MKLARAMPYVRTWIVLAGLAIAAMPMYGASSEGAVTEPFDHVCLMNELGWRDASGPASDPTPLDVPMGTTGAAGTDALLIGHSARFETITFNLGQAGMGGTLAWWYWDGTAFRPAEIEQDLTRSGAVHVTLPTLPGWTATTDGYMCAAGHYYILVTTSTGYTVIPIANSLGMGDLNPGSGVGAGRPSANTGGSPSAVE